VPFARFEKLAPEKRERLIDVAAQEFATRGFEQASLNRILEQAQIGKGSAYYYFEDKADLFCTVVQYAMRFLDLATPPDADLASLTAEHFWPMLAEMRRVPLLRSFERPWLFMVLHVAAQVSPSIPERPTLTALVEQTRSGVLKLITHGQELGCIRTDVPNDLLLSWLLALDQASDNWLMSHWEYLDQDVIVRISQQTIAALERAFSPDVVSSTRAQPSAMPTNQPRNQENKAP